MTTDTIPEEKDEEEDDDKNTSSECIVLLCKYIKSFDKYPI